MDNKQETIYSVRLMPKEAERLRQHTELAADFGLISKATISEWLRYCIEAGATMLYQHYTEVKRQLETQQQQQQQQQQEQEGEEYAVPCMQ